MRHLKNSRRDLRLELNSRVDWRVWGDMWAHYTRLPNKEAAHLTDALSKSDGRF